METFSKDRHGFSKNDIQPKGKMNFDVPGNQATAQYLVLMQSNEINVVVLRAKDASIKDATNLSVETTDDLRSKHPTVSISSEENYCEETLHEEKEVNVQNSTANIEFFENNNIGGFTKEDLTLLQSFGGLNLKDYSKEYNKEGILKTSGFVVVTRKCGSTIIVRKTSLYWLLSESSLRNIHKEKNDKSERPFMEKEKIQIDEWVGFSKSDEKGCLVGLVLGFSLNHQQKMLEAYEYILCNFDIAND
ncbi:hypothetical protein FQA39_LY15559 [Lamprigera yunnana]|nr:hypothetical protein FQA39_LY15559 [Lamprigera yunnana]